MTEEEKELVRKMSIVDNLRRFNVFLKSTKFEAQDIEVILKSMGVWTKGLKKAKRVD